MRMINNQQGIFIASAASQSHETRHCPEQGDSHGATRIGMTYPQNGRGERPECGADAPAFLSAVYKRGTQAKKRPADVLQYGRSMIEMLGVLAIIGVLSVGGIMGYSKAMMRYKINKTIEQITYIAGNVRTLFKDDYSSMSFSNEYLSKASHPNRKIIAKAHLFPEEIINNNYKNLYDGEIKLYASGLNAANDGKAFVLSMYGIPPEACLELATKNWNNNLGVVASKIVPGEASTSPGISTAYLANCQRRGQIFCKADIPLNIDEATSFCDFDNVGMMWKFD